MKGLYKHQFLLWLTTLLTFSCDPRDGEFGRGLVDDVSLIDGLVYEVLISWGDQISDLHYFGYDNDQLILFGTAKEPMLLVSHENVNTLFVSGFYPWTNSVRRRAEVRKERYQVGISTIRLKQKRHGCEVIQHSKNARLTGVTQVPFEWKEGIGNRTSSYGLVAVGACALTPWSTILTAEGNYRKFFGAYNYKNRMYHSSELLWEGFLGIPMQQFGWIAEEVDSETGETRKHVSMGRFAHESATLAQLPDGRVAVYSTDHSPNGRLYKYVSDIPGQMSPGKLFVANLKNGTWNPLDYSYDQLNEVFSSETEMLIRSREAGSVVGGTAFEYPAGVAIDPVSGDVYLVIEGFENNPFGSILRLSETGGDHDAKTLRSEIFMNGDESEGLVRPHELNFDSQGNLWIASDIPASDLGKGEFKNLFRNALYVWERKLNQVTEVARAPIDDSFGGLCFDQESETVLLSVKHPEALTTAAAYTSSWPGGTGTTPKPSVITLEGGYLEEI